MDETEIIKKINELTLQISQLNEFIRQDDFNYHKDLQKFIECIKEGDTNLAKCILHKRPYFKDFVIDYEFFSEKIKVQPIHIACLFGQLDIIVHLIDVFGVDVNQKDGSGNTPLIIASMWDHIAVVKLLLKRDADRSIRNKEGRTAYNVAMVHDIKTLLQTE